MWRWLALLVVHGMLHAASPVLLVLHKAASFLGFYTLEGELLARVVTGRHPHEMTVSPDERYVWITDNGTMRIEEPGSGGNTVSVVDVKARRRVAVIPLGEFRRPHGIAFHAPSGRVAVSTELPDRLVVIDAASRRIVRSLDTGGKTSHIVAWDRPGRWVFVSNAGSANVAAVDTETGAIERIPTGTRPEGSVLSPDGSRLYVVNRDGAAVTVIDAVRRQPAGQIATGRGPVRIGITPDGKLLVYALMHDQAVEFADPSAGKVVERVALEGRPVSLHVSSDGRLAFAAAQEEDVVYVISVPERKIVRRIRTPEGSGPDAVWLLGAG
ncbi:MAG: YncE family protein [Bryobacteraceae bacterium]|nr:YncE family protein [Bryobacteraceae bacterium]